MQRGERSRHTRSGRTNRMLRLTTRRLLYTIPYHCDHLSFLPRSLCLCLSLSLHVSLFLSLSLNSSCIHPLAITIVPLSIFRSRSCLFRSSLCLPSARFLSIYPRHSSTTLSRSHVRFSFLYLSFCLSYPLCSPFSYFVHSARRTVAVSLAPPSNRRSTGRFCI